MFKRNVLLFVCMILLILVGADSWAAEASAPEGLEDNILLARADHGDEGDWDDEDEDWDDEDEDDEDDWDDEDEDDEEFEHRRRREFEEMIEEHMPDAMEYLEEINPDLYEQIVNEDDNVPHEFIDQMMHFTRLWLEWQENDEREKGLEFELKGMTMRFELNLLVRDFHESRSEKERKQIRTDVQELLVELFDFEIARREYRIAELQRELDELKQNVKKAKNDKDGQIKAYLDRLTSSQTIFDR
ncbi:MAG: hypothetical protein ACYSUT_12530 [Planctomycetota bacterium]